MNDKTFLVFLYTAIAGLAYGQSDRYVKVLDPEYQNPIDSMELIFSIQGSDVASFWTNADGLAKIPDSFFIGNNTKGYIRGHRGQYLLIGNTISDFVRDTLVLKVGVIHDYYFGAGGLPFVYFTAGSYDVSDTFKKEMTFLINVLKEEKSFKLEISGHTDSTEAGDTALSQMRADHVKVYIVSQGINRDRIVTKAYGSSKTLAPGKKDGADDPAGRAQNRRVSFKVYR